MTKLIKIANATPAPTLPLLAHISTPGQRAMQEHIARRLEEGARLLRATSPATAFALGISAARP